MIGLVEVSRTKVCRLEGVLDLHMSGCCCLLAQVAPLCRVAVSGVSEGRPENVLSADPDAWFETDESADPMPWIQVILPSNVRVVHFSR